MVSWDISRGYSGRDYNSIINAFNNSSNIKENLDTAFHYTSFENCIKMLKKSNENNYLELFASHFNYMNDTKEFFEGLSSIICLLEKDNFSDTKIKKTVNEFIRYFKDYDKIPYSSIPPHYIISFNTSCNNLAQWKYYGKNCGVSIEYDLKNCIYSNNSIEDDLYSEHKSFYVIYDHNKQMEEIKLLLSDLHSLEQSQDELNKEIHAQDILLRACAAASYMKNKHYSEEKEIRLLFAPYYSDSSEESSEVNLNKLIRKIEYRPRGDEYIIPYMKIRLKHKNDNYPIKSLTVGPGQNQNTIYNSLIMFIQSNFCIGNSIIKELPNEDDCLCLSVNGIKVKKSLIPFRG